MSKVLGECGFKGTTEISQVSLKISWLCFAHEQGPYGFEALRGRVNYETFLGWALSLTHIPNLNYPKWVSTQRLNSSIFISIPVLFRSLYVRIPSLEIRRSTMMDRPNTSGLYASRPLFFRVMDTSAELSETKTVWETIDYDYMQRNLDRCRTSLLPSQILWVRSLC